MFEKNLIPHYEITPQTIAVIAQVEDGKTTSLILEEEAQYETFESPSKVIDQACKFFGSSLKGRQEGTREISGLTHKAPISIDPQSGMYFFPTASPVKYNCSWIAHTHIKTIREAKYGMTEIEFNNEKKIIFDVSLGSMMNQIQRTAQFRYLLDHRIKHLQSFQNPQGQTQTQSNE